MDGGARLGRRGAIEGLLSRAAALSWLLAPPRPTLQTTRFYSLIFAATVSLAPRKCCRRYSNNKIHERKIAELYISRTTVRILLTRI